MSDSHNSDGSETAVGNEDHTDFKRNREKDTSNRSENKESESVEVCWNFLKNRCNRGDDCKYQHTVSEVSGERSRSRSPISNTGESPKKSAVCRDFARNMCNRGSNCRYYHPPDEAAKKKSWFTLCLDFQNGKCSRQDCRYFHITPDDEELFKQTGDISMHIIDQAMRKAPVFDATSKSNRPTCSDYLKGVCNRKNCRYRHINSVEYESEIYKSLKKELRQLVEQDNGTASSSGFETPLDSNRENSVLGSNERANVPTSNLFRREGMASDSRNSSNFHIRGGLSSFSRDSRGSGSFGSLPYQVGRRFENQTAAFTPSFSEPLSRNDSFPSQGDMERNKDLDGNLKDLIRRNEELMNELKVSKNWENIYNETKAQLQTVQLEKQTYFDKITALETEISALRNNIRSWESYEQFVRDQVFNLKNHVLTIERELPHSVGGGSTLLSQKTTWSFFLNVLNSIANYNNRKDISDLTKCRESYSYSNIHPGGEYSGNVNPYQEAANISTQDTSTLPYYNQPNQGMPPGRPLNPK